MCYDRQSVSNPYFQYLFTSPPPPPPPSPDMACIVTKRDTQKIGKSLHCVCTETGETKFTEVVGHMTSMASYHPSGQYISTFGYPDSEVAAESGRVYYLLQVHPDTFEVAATFELADACGFTGGDLGYTT